MNLINRTACKRAALEISKLKGRKFTRVSKEFLDDLEANLRASIAARVHAAPGRKTL